MKNFISALGVVLVTLAFLMVLAVPATARAENTEQKHSTLERASDLHLSYADILSAQNVHVDSNLIEERNPSLPSQDSKHYVTPFSEAAQRLIVDAFIAKERALSATDGVIVDVALSSREVLGYSDVARAQSAQEIGIDPVDLHIENTAEDQSDTYIEKWRAWRNAKLRDLVRKLALAYKANFPHRRLYLYGEAGYYKNPNQWFNDIRSGQDWKSWIRTGLFDGIVLRGNWNDRSGDPRAFQATWQQLKATPIAPVSGQSVPLELYPLFDAAPKSETFNWQCATLLKWAPDLTGIVVPQSDGHGYKRLIDYKKSLVLPQYPVPRLGELLAPWPLYHPDRSYVDWETFFTAGGTALLICPKGVNHTVSQLFPALAAQGRKVGLITPKLPQKDKTEEAIFNALLLDKEKQIVKLYPKGETALLFDSAGFLRSIEFRATPQSIPPSVTPSCQVGEQAPDFLLPDMNGQLRHISSLRGKKNVLITFFPKCFTGGCTNHLTSIRDVLPKFTDSDTEVWAVSVDAADVQVAFAARWQLNFPLIPDEGRNLCLLYGAARDKTQLADRMSVLIDKTGKVRWIDRHVNIPTHGADILAQMTELGLR